MSLDKEAAEYASKTPRSRSLHEEALAVMPGGNSRTTTFFDPYPFYIQRGQGAHIWDADGIERVDFNGNYTSLILGHAPPDVVKSVQAVGRVRPVVPRPDRARGAAGRDDRPAGALGREPALHQLGHRGHHERRAPGPRLHRTAQDGQVRGRLSRHPRLGDGERERRYQVVGQSRAGPSRSPGRPGCRRRCSRTRWSCRGTMPRPARRFSTKEGATIAAVIVDPYMCNAGLLPPVDGFLRAAARGDRAPRHRADLRRGDLVPHRVGRRPGALRHPARPHHLRQDHRRRPAGRRLRRTARRHGLLRSAQGRRAHQPGRHVQRQPGDDGRRRGDAERADAGGLHAAGRAQRAAERRRQPAAHQHAAARARSRPSARCSGCTGRPRR